MSLNDFKLSAELQGHSLDVRCVTNVKNYILSGSRDKTAKIWERVGQNSFADISTLKNHSNYVSSICVINNGKWICTGSNDSTICVYNFGDSEPFRVLKDHKNTVSTLCEGLESNMLLSGSWDQTARLWRNIDSGLTSIELKGHEAAIWCLASIKNGSKYATGSADKNIFIWNSSGQKVVVLKGHTDCVRGLVSLDDGSLLSCANDASIRHWSDTWETLREFHGHSNYIYTIARNPALGSGVFVTGSEDNTIRMWSVTDGALGDALAIPAQSVWSVCCDENGDIIAGSSDAVVRVFTKAPERIISEELLTAFNIAVETRKKEQTKELGGIKVNDLPGPESLLQEGTEGQTRLVREPNGNIMCYQWTNNKWELVGDVTGASGGSDETSGKKLFEGKEYDFVFNVDIKDDAPPIKLPFNKGDDPWHSAQQFIYKHDLPQVYLEQIANFIITNANIKTLPPPTNNQEFADPFTGGGRYIPGSSGDDVSVGFRSRTNENVGAVNVDPFTGGSSYSSVKNPSLIQRYIPSFEFMTFDVYDGQKVFDKLKEFNQKTGNEFETVSDDVLAGVIRLAEKHVLVQDDSTFMNALNSMLNWPQNLLFPVLDVVRLAVRHENTCKALGNKFLEAVVENLATLPANQLMSIRTLCNMMKHQYGRELFTQHMIDITNGVSVIIQGTANLQIAIGTFYLNAAVNLKQSPSEEISTMLSINLVKFLNWVTDQEAIFRTYLAIGNLVTTNEELVVTIVKSVDSVIEKLKENKNSSLTKLAELSAELAEKLKVF